MDPANNPQQSRVPDTGDLNSSVVPEAGILSRAAPVVFSEAHARDLFQFLVAYDQEAGPRKSLDKALYQRSVLGEGEHVVQSVSEELVNSYELLMTQQLSSWRDAILELREQAIERAFAGSPEERKSFHILRNIINELDGIEGMEIFSILKAVEPLRAYAPVAFQEERGRMSPSSIILVRLPHDPLEQFCSDRQFPEQLTRIYVNCTPELALTLARSLLQNDEVRDGIDQIKMVNFALGDTLSEKYRSRYDRLIVYADLRMEAQILGQIEVIAAQHPDDFHAGKLPLFTREVLPGVGLGEEPGGSWSFSSLRSHLLLQLTQDVTAGYLRAQGIDSPAGKVFCDSNRSMYEGDEAQFFDGDMQEFFAGQSSDMVLQFSGRIAAVMGEEAFCKACLERVVNLARAMNIDPADFSRNLSRGTSYAPPRDDSGDLNGFLQQLIAKMGKPGKN